MPINNFQREICNPLEQFEVRDLLFMDFPLLGYLHLSITNIGLYLTIGMILIFTLSLLSTNYNKLVSNS
jgi:F-type H+-transporting ATPase subunit a